ncbi:hypothetical protein ACI6Q2_09540 [Chitinophagaceae bacterium LWZ2-11]
MKCRSTPLLLCINLVCACSNLFAQQDTTLSKETDIFDIARSIFAKHADSALHKKPKTVVILPAIGYNPSIGFQYGISVTGGVYLSSQENTTLSVGAATAYMTTKGILAAQFRHNVFTKGNKWNFQGNWQTTKMVVLDYGIGTGNMENRQGNFSWAGFILQNPDSSFPITYKYLRFTERAYKEIAPHVYAGVGLSFDIREKIDDERLDSPLITPHYTYSKLLGFDPTGYNACGFLFDILYNTKEHPNRAFGGTYLDIGTRINQTWIGSTKNAVQLLTELRQYWSLSKRNPEEVLAIWHIGSYRLSGDLPYLELPGTGQDTYGRSGRGYTAGRFKGPAYFYLETEYRFPISANKLFSGVVFLNMQSASNGANIKLFQYWEPGYGAGLRVLFNKNTRTNICIDYARGRYGSSGIFFGLNEAF